MNSSEIVDIITTVVREAVGDDTVTLGRETTAQDVTGWDSLTHTEIIVGVEKWFGIRFTSYELLGMATVGDLADLVASKRSARGPK